MGDVGWSLPQKARHSGALRSGLPDGLGRECRVGASCGLLCAPAHWRDRALAWARIESPDQGCNRLSTDERAMSGLACGRALKWMWVDSAA